MMCNFYLFKSTKIHFILYYVRGKQIDSANITKLKFRYDAFGNRIVKDIVNKSKEIYVRDAQGNPIVLYEIKNDSLMSKEYYIYGTNKLGYMEDKAYMGKKMSGKNVGDVGVMPAQIFPNLPNPFVFAGTTSMVPMYFGKKRYELSDWLGNVRVVVNDRKTPVNTGSVTVSYMPQVVGVTDYYSFGSSIVERSYDPVKPKYRFGFNTQEKVNEISPDHYTAKYWEYDSRLGRRWERDPIIKYHESPYATFVNNPIWFSDHDGRDTSFADDNARQEFKSTYKSIDNAIKKLNSKIENKLAIWIEKGYDNEKINKRMIRQIGRLNEKRSQLIEIKNSFDEVINSDIMYFYAAKPNPDGMYLSGGGTSYNTDKNRVDIWFYSGNTGTIVHETRHGAGYSLGEWGWNSNTNTPTNYDYQDEYESYRQESNYLNILNIGISRTKLEIMNVIKMNYGNKDFIIKDFHQSCESKRFYE